MPSHYIQANTGGRLHPATEPSLSPLNRSFLYGDSIYEVWRTYGGVLFAWSEHWERLLDSAAALRFQFPWTAADLLGEIKRTIAEYRRQAPEAADYYVRLQIARGDGSIGLDPALADAAQFVILVQPCPYFLPPILARGLTLSVAQSLRRNPALSLSPAWKTGNYLNNLLCLREARERGADEVVILNLAGEVTEAAVSNIAFIEGRTVVTPPETAGILRGITRRLLLGEVARSAGYSVAERTVRPDDFPQMRECFLLSTTKDITPVRAIDRSTFGVGLDSAALHLKAAFAEYASAYASAHPELRV